jgi:hypothetical protein
MLLKRRNKMSDRRKRLEARDIKFLDPGHPINSHGTIILFPRNQECGEHPPREQVPFWEAAYGPNLAEVYVLHPQLLYPDLQNLPFDPALEAMKHVNRIIGKAE